MIGISRPSAIDLAKLAPTISEPSNPGPCVKAIALSAELLYIGLLQRRVNNGKDVLLMSPRSQFWNYSPVLFMNLLACNNIGLDFAIMYNRSSSIVTRRFNRKNNYVFFIRHYGLINTRFDGSLTNFELLKKVFSKIAKFGLRTLIILVLLVLVVSVLVSIPAIQTAIVNEVSYSVSKSIETEVKIKSVNFSWNGQVVLHDVFSARQTCRFDVFYRTSPIQGASV